MAIGIRDERDVAMATLAQLNVAVMQAVNVDRAAYTTNTSARLAKSAEQGLCPAVHRRIKPMKRKARAARMLLLDKNGFPTANKTEEATAVKAYIAVRGRSTG